MKTIRPLVFVRVVDGVRDDLVIPAGTETRRAESDDYQGHEIHMPHGARRRLSELQLFDLFKERREALKEPGDGGAGVRVVLAGRVRLVPRDALDLEGA